MDRWDQFVDSNNNKVSDLVGNHNKHSYELKPLNFTEVLAQWQSKLTSKFGQDIYFL